MATALAEAHIEAQRRLRALAAEAVARVWRGLGSWDRADVPRFLEGALPTVLTAQRGSVMLTEAYLAQSLERQPLGVNPEEIIGANLRNGTSPQEVYERPFITLWTALGAGKPFADAFSSGMARATGSAAMDVQMAFRSTAAAVQEADDGIYGYERVPDGGACDFCLEVAGAFVKSADAMPLHNHCGCGLEPVTSPRRGAPFAPPETVAVHQHGELGPVLTDPAHDFTSAAVALG